METIKIITCVGDPIQYDLDPDPEPWMDPFHEIMDPAPDPKNLCLYIFL